MKTVYLAGPIAGLTVTEANDWRVKAWSELKYHGILGLSPMRGKMDKFGRDEVLTNQGYDKDPMTTQHGIVTRDRNDVMTCDMVLVNWTGVNKASVGTFVEYGWADAFRKPIITIMDTDDPNHVANHAFIKELSGFTVKTLEDGLKVCVRILGK